MEDNKIENPPAFPTTKSEFINQSDPLPTTGTFGGMALRDYFAAKAMQSLITRKDRLISTTTGRGEITHTVDEFAEMISRESFKFADAMLKLR